MPRDKQASEASFGAEVDHQASLLVNTHAGRVERACKRREPSDGELPFLSTERGGAFVFSRFTLELGLRRAADAVPPQDGGVVHKSQPQLGLEVKMLPAAGPHGRVEHVGHVERHPQRHVGLDQVQYLP